MELIIVSRVFNDFKFNDQSSESIRFAAHRWGVNYLELFTENKNGLNDILRDFISNRFHCFYDFLNYDKILILDPDIVINKNCPNIFNELDEDTDLAVVKDGNPGRFKNYNYENIVDYISNFGIEIFEYKIKNFERKKYRENYFNNGVFLFKPKKILHKINELEKLIKTDNDFINFFSKEKGDFFCLQNSLNAILTFSDVKIKYLDNTWNWIAPDIVEEYEMFLEPMIPNIYHFCGTNLAKERLKDYDRWK
jgi:lipopolysaccharide biosynthesis glycosyltransferase